MTASGRSRIWPWMPFQTANSELLKPTLSKTETKKFKNTVLVISVSKDWKIHFQMIVVDILVELGGWSMTVKEPFLCQHGITMASVIAVSQWLKVPSQSLAKLFPSLFLRQGVISISWFRKFHILWKFAFTSLNKLHILLLQFFLHFLRESEYLHFPCQDDKNFIHTNSRRKTLLFS